MQQPDPFQAKTLLGIQATLALMAVVAALPFGGSVALSVLVGAGACLLANALFAVWVFRDYRAQSPARLVRSLYVAEIAKLAVVLAALMTAFATLDGLNIPALLGAYLALQYVPTLIAAQWHGRTTK